MVGKQTNKRTARRHVRTHETEHANRRKTTHEQGHKPKDERTGKSAANPQSPRAPVHPTNGRNRTQSWEDRVAVDVSPSAASDALSAATVPAHCSVCERVAHVYGRLRLRVLGLARVLLLRGPSWIHGHRPCRHSCQLPHLLRNRRHRRTVKPFRFGPRAALAAAAVSAAATAAAIARSAAVAPRHAALDYPLLFRRRPRDGPGRGQPAHLQAQQSHARNPRAQQQVCPPHKTLVCAPALGFEGAILPTSSHWAECSPHVQPRIPSHRTRLGASNWHLTLLASARFACAAGESSR